MDPNIFRFIIIPVVVFCVMGLTRFARKKLAKPAYEGEVQKPGLFDRFWAMVIKVIAVLSGLFTILGLFMSEMEMAIVFAVITLITAVLSIFISRKFDISYQEKDEFFIVRERKQEYKVFYDDIIDWKPSFNEIRILDKSKTEDKFIPVNVEIFTPEILLKKMVEKTFEGQFIRTDGINYEDPKREQEMINFLIQYNYNHLVKDYVERGY